MTDVVCTVVRQTPTPMAYSNSSVRGWPRLPSIAVISPPRALGIAIGIKGHTSTRLKDVGMSHFEPSRTTVLTYMHVHRVPCCMSGVERNLFQVIRMDGETQMDF